MRWPIKLWPMTPWPAVGTAVCVAGAGIVGGWLLATSSTTDAADWRGRDLLFLKAAHDRVQSEIRERAGAGVEASLRREQRALLQAMAAVARPMPADRIPVEVRHLLTAHADTPPPDTPPPETMATLIAMVTSEDSPGLRSGLDEVQAARLDLTGFAVAADLRLPLPSPRARKTRSDKAPGGKRGED